MTLSVPVQPGVLIAQNFCYCTYIFASLLKSHGPFSLIFMIFPAEKSKMQLQLWVLLKRYVVHSFSLLRIGEMDSSSSVFCAGQHWVCACTGCSSSIFNTLRGAPPLQSILEIGFLPKQSHAVHEGASLPLVLSLLSCCEDSFSPALFFFIANSAEGFIFFKKCIQCVTKMPCLDEHLLCLSFLGEGHNTATCKSRSD